MAVRSGYIAISLNDLEIQAIEFEHGFKNIILHNYGRMDLPPGVIKNGRIVEPNALAEVISNLLASTKPSPSTSKDLVFILPDELTFFHSFSLAGDLQPEQVKNMIPVEAEKYVPFSRDDIFWDYAISSSESSTNVQYSAISKNILNEYLDVFVGMKLNPTLVTNRYEAYKIVPLFDNSDSASIIELNKDSIKLICVHENIIRSVSSYDFDYQAFVSTVGQYIDPSTHKLKDACIPQLDPVIASIKQDIQANECFKNSDHVYVWGSQVKDSYLYEYLDKKIERKFVVEELWEPISLHNNLNSHQETISLINKNKITFGLIAAVSSVFLYNQNTKCLNLLPDERRKTIITKSVGKIFSFAGLVLFAVNLALMFVLSYYALDFTFDLNILNSRAKNFEGLIYGARYDELRTDILSFNAEVDKLYNLDNSIIDLPDVYKTVLNIDRVGISLGLVSYNKPTGILSLSGVASTRTELLSFKEEITALSGIGEVEFPLSNLDKSEDISFEININLNTELE